MQVKKIGVLMGGFSSEREISLKSGNAVVQALQSCDFDTVIFDFQSPGELIDKIKKSNVDCVFNALHGTFGEDGQVQQILDDLEIPYTGSGVQASQLAMDKTESHNIFKANGISVPEYVVFRPGDHLSEEWLSYFPLVVKPAHEGSSIGLSIIEDADDLPLALEEAFKFDKKVLIERYIKGREITVGILEDEPLPVIEVIPKNKFYDFQAKYTLGMTEYKVPAFLPETTYLQAQSLALKAHRILGCRCFSRVDMLIGQGDKLFVLEVNTIPGFTSTSLLPKAAAARGISFPELCRKMVLSSVEIFSEKSVKYSE
ncbi:MAG: D-alanine--D-alanine ligase [Candidatus Omnitrophota bacterium]